MDCSVISLSCPLDRNNESINYFSYVHISLTALLISLTYYKSHASLLFKALEILKDMYNIGLLTALLISLTYYKSHASLLFKALEILKDMYNIGLLI